MATDTPIDRSDLVSRSWTALAIGVGLLVVGAVTANWTGRSLDTAAVGASVAIGVMALGAMTIQAAIVGFVFGSHDGVRRLPVVPTGEGERASRAAGWYEDPKQPGVWRWWDGWDWTARRTDDPASTA